MLAGTVSSLIEWVSRPLAWSIVVIVDDEYWGPYFDYLAFARLFERFADSVLIVSYRSDGTPSADELTALLQERFGTRVKALAATLFIAAILWWLRTPSRIAWLAFVAAGALMNGLHALGLPAYDPVAIDGAALSVPDALAACRALLHASREERAALGFMHPGRVDVIGAGALILRVIMDALDLEEVVVSEHDILDGIALRLAR